MTQPVLFDPTVPSEGQATYSVHCFFDCGHVTRAEDPAASSAAMKQHYAEQHTADIDRSLSFIGAPRPATPAP